MAGPLCLSVQSCCSVHPARADTGSPVRIKTEFSIGKMEAFVKFTATSFRICSAAWLLFTPVLPRTPAMGIFPSSPRLRLGQDARRHLNSNLLPLRQKPDEIIPELMLSAAPSPFSHLQYSLESTPVFPETVRWPDVYPHPVSHQEQPLFPAVLQSGPRSPY